jgi:hypothetical protein
LRRTERLDLLCDLWNDAAIKALERTFEARLIPLNKVWPDIPREDQFRPIVVLSPMYKWLELRFAPRLMRYLTDSLDRNQTGFVRGMGTHVNLRLLVEKLRTSRRRDGICCVFIDYKSAYNTVRRDVLYRALITKQILTTDEARFLERLHDCLYFKVGADERYHFRNGVHQGSPISPALFDIYMEDVMREICSSCTDDNLWYKLYADDVVLVTSHDHLNSLLKALMDVSARYNLKINAKKSAVFTVKGHDKLTSEHDLRGIPVVSEYNYLGVTVDDSGSLAAHLNRVKQRSSYLRSHLRYHACHLSFENQYLLWAVYVRPYFTYVAPLLET